MLVLCKLINVCIFISLPLICNMLKGKSYLTAPEQNTTVVTHTFKVIMSGVAIVVPIVCMRTNRI